MINNIFMMIETYGDVFISGLWITLLLSAITVFFGTLLGAVICLCKMAKFKPLSWLAAAYVEIIRGTPLLLQLSFFYFLLPQMLPVDPGKFTCVALALALNSAAYVAEIIRAGIQAVDKGQTEAARSLGLSGSQTMTRVVVPQAVRNILPALANEFVMVIKETSLASNYYVGDLMTAHLIVRSATYTTLEPLMIVGFIYFCCTFTLSKLISILERRLNSGD